MGLGAAGARRVRQLKKPEKLDRVVVFGGVVGTRDIGQIGYVTAGLPRVPTSSTATGSPLPHGKVGDHGPLKGEEKPATPAAESSHSTDRQIASLYPDTHRSLLSIYVVGVCDIVQHAGWCRLLDGPYRRFRYHASTRITRFWETSTAPWRYPCVYIILQ